MITVLRLGHRAQRDKRITTHCGLVARAFGADKIIYAGEEDQPMIESVNRVSQKWGGTFKAEYAPEWRKALKNFKGTKVHLTFYGMPLKESVKKIKAKKPKSLLVIIGAEKVPREVYELADFNVCIGSQPHSEVAALAIFLHEYFGGKELEKKFGGSIELIPQHRGKRIVENPKNPVFPSA